MFGHPYLTPWHIVLAIVVILDILAGIFIIRRSKRTPASLLFAGVLFSAGLWGAALVAMYIAHPYSVSASQFGSNLAFSSTSLLAYFGVVFSLYFPVQQGLSRLSNAALFLPAIFFVIVSHLSLVDSEIRLVEGKLVSVRSVFYVPFLVFLLVYLLATQFRLFYGIKFVSQNEKPKAFVVAMAFLLAILFGVFFNVVWPALYPLSPLSYIGPVGISSLILVLAWGVVVYRLFDLPVRIEKDQIVKLVTGVLFFVLLILLTISLDFFQNNFWGTLVIAFIFSLLFLNTNSYIASFVDRVQFNEYFDNAITEKEEGSLDQVRQMRGEVFEFFARFFSRVSVDIFYWDDAHSVFRSLRKDRGRMILAPKDPLTNFARSTTGVVFLDDLDQYNFLKESERAIVLRKLDKLDARVLVTMRHWTNELVMIAFISCDPITDEQRFALKQRLEFQKPDWDAIAARIYTNKRAVESVNEYKT